MRPLAFGGRAVVAVDNNVVFIVFSAHLLWRAVRQHFLLLPAVYMHVCVFSLAFILNSFVLLFYYFIIIIFFLQSLSLRANPQFREEAG